jgi:hypothetical protein
MFENPPPWMARVTAVAVVVLLVAGIAGAALAGGDDDDGGDRQEDAAPGATTTSTTEAEQSTETTAPPADGVGIDLGVAVVELSEFVAQERNLEFREEVAVELLDGDAFNERLFADAEEDRADVEESERVLRALQLIPPDVDLFEVVQRFLGDSTLGFYDPETNELVVRGAELTPYVRATLVHELVHALDDQHFELYRPDLIEADDERFSGFQALYEGNAVRVQEAYEASLTDDERRQLSEEEAEFGSAIDLSGVPQVVPELLSFPYLAGPLFVDALVEDGGEVRVDEALREPPVSTEQILHPELFLDGEAVDPVDVPAADGEVLEQGAYGEWVLLLTLAQEISVADAQRAAMGWGGDAYVAWAEGDRTCLRATFVMDTPRDLDELADAWQRWADAHGDATVDVNDDSVTVTPCG